MLFKLVTMSCDPFFDYLCKTANTPREKRNTQASLGPAKPY